ncbi:MAG: hypothetical protein DI598_19900, partial [Pseudopedobacter saltans]
MQSEIVQRLGEYMNVKKLNQSEFATLLGYDSSEKISRLFRKEGAKPSADIIEDISNKFEDLNIEWWLTGKGGMLKEISDIAVISEPQSYLAKRRSIKNRSVSVIQKEYQGVPIFNVPIDASFLERFRDEAYYEPIGFLNLPKLRNCDFAAVISGNSMYPLMKSGSIVVCRIVNANLNTDAAYFDEGE